MEMFPCYKGDIQKIFHLSTLLAGHWESMMNGILKLEVLLKNMRPEMSENEYVFCTKRSTVTFSGFIMEYQWYDFVGNIGVFLILLAYLLLQLDKINNQSIRFSLLNAFGALSILISLYFKFNLSAFIIELFWLLISLVGIIRFWGNKGVSRKYSQQQLTNKFSGRKKPRRTVQPLFVIKKVQGITF